MNAEQLLVVSRHLVEEDCACSVITGLSVIHIIYVHYKVDNRVLHYTEKCHFSLCKKILGQANDQLLHPPPSLDTQRHSHCLSYTRKCATCVLHVQYTCNTCVVFRFTIHASYTCIACVKYL